MNFTWSLVKNMGIPLTVLLTMAVRILFTVLDRVGVVDLELCSAPG